MPITLDNTSITGLGVGGLPAGSVNATTLADAAVTRAKMGYAGAVLQVVSTNTNGSFSTSATSFVDITGMSVTITPNFSTSRILITGHMQCGGNNDARYHAFKLLRGTTSLAEGNRGGNNGTNAFISSGGPGADGMTFVNENIAWSLLDTPNTTSSLTYKMQVNPNSILNTRIFYLNRPENLSDNLRIWTSSTITVMEIAG